MNLRLMLGAVLFFLGTLVCTGFVCAEESPLSLRFKVGEEYDTNARRIEGSDSEGDFVTRLFLKLQYAVRSGDREHLFIKLRSGGKLFAEFGDENTFLNQIDLQYTIFLPEPFQLQVWGMFKDRTEDVHHWDYLRGSAMGGLVLSADPFRARVGGGYRFFMFKPDEDIFNDGPSLEAAIWWTPEEAISISVSSVIYWKAYLSQIRVKAEDGGIQIDESATRDDLLTTFRLSFQYRGPFYLQADYSYLLNDSNSHGQSLDRHSFNAIVTIPIVLDLILGLRGSIQRTIYDDPFFIDPTFGIDEENRNSLEVSLSYALIDLVSIEANFSWYGQELEEGMEYDRKLFYLGLTVENQ